MKAALMNMTVEARSRYMQCLGMVTAYPGKLNLRDLEAMAQKRGFRNWTQVVNVAAQDRDDA